MSDPAKSFASGRVKRLASHSKVSIALWWGFSPWQVFSNLLKTLPAAEHHVLWGGCASPTSPVLSPVPLLPAAQLGGFPWAAAELGPDVSNGPIMPDVFTAFGRK